MYQQISLWDSHSLQSQTKKKLNIINIDGEVWYYPYFLDQQTSNNFFDNLQKDVCWKQEHIKIFGKKIPLPRLTAWYGDEGKSYTYSGIRQNPEPWNRTLLALKDKVEDVAEMNFNSVLLNLYRDGSDSVSWHSDDEDELGQNPVIASVSLGGTRKFSLKHKNQNILKESIELVHGSLLIMKGETQHQWLHQIPKTSKLVKPRINLTFRMIQNF